MQTGKLQQSIHRILDCCTLVSLKVPLRSTPSASNTSGRVIQVAAASTPDSQTCVTCQLPFSIQGSRPTHSPRLIRAHAFPSKANELPAAWTIGPTSGKTCTDIIRTNVMWSLEIGRSRQNENEADQLAASVPTPSGQGFGQRARD